MGYMVSPSPLSPADVTVPAIIAYQVFPPIGEMDGDGGYPIQHGEHPEVSLEDRISLLALAIIPTPAVQLFIANLTDFS